MLEPAALNVCVLASTVPKYSFTQTLRNQAHTALVPSPHSESRRPSLSFWWCCRGVRKHFQRNHCLHQRCIGVPPELHFLSQLSAYRPTGISAAQCGGDESYASQECYKGAAPTAQRMPRACAPPTPELTSSKLPRQGSWWAWGTFPKGRTRHDQSRISRDGYAEAPNLVQQGPPLTRQIPISKLKMLGRCSLANTGGFTSRTCCVLQGLFHARNIGKLACKWYGGQSVVRLGHYLEDEGQQAPWG